VEHIDLHAEVVKEMKRRDDHEKIQDREMAQRSLESGQVDDAIDVEKFGKRLVSDGFPMSFFDNQEARKAVLMTTECGQNYIRTKPGGSGLPSRCVSRCYCLLSRSCVTVTYN
jgi:hypothetical protein